MILLGFARPAFLRYVPANYVLKEIFIKDYRSHGIRESTVSIQYLSGPASWLTFNR